MKLRTFIRILILLCIVVTTRNIGDVPLKTDILMNMEHHEGFSIESADLTPTSSELGIPRQINLSHLPRTSHASANRTVATGNSGHILVKNGKLVNNNISYPYLNNQLRFPSGVAGREHHLISLRKLVI